LDELKCEKSKHLLETIPYEIVIREPSKESLQIVCDCSKKTGDYASLSVVDLKVLALTHDLHVQTCGKDKLNYDCKKTADTRAPDSEAVKSGDDEHQNGTDGDAAVPEKKYDALAGFYNPSSSSSAKQVGH
uniref:RNA-binding protein NOB1 (inferred by orthology to a human protein) n=1 Tax=Anisakis simplex TaxID=6269 RepID=A0A0M3J8A7_ANISI